ncbi:MAG: MarR family transcriptional regulator [Clostridia bacterium]|nr:MarR family transcriptional regulator [Clostridia bacterium]
MLDRFQQFSFSVSEIHRYLLQIEREEMEKLGYKAYFAQYLVTMSRHPEGVTAVELGKACDKDKAAVSRAVSEMIEKGLLTRQLTGGNGYRAPLHLTKKGQQVARHVCDRARLAVTAVGGEIDGDRRRVFYDVLTTIADNLRRVSEQGIPE